jgi:hypothetical protein
VSNSSCASSKKKRRKRPALRPTRAHLAALILLLVRRVDHDDLRQRARQLAVDRPGRSRRIPASDWHFPTRSRDARGLFGSADAENRAGVPRVRHVDALRGLMRHHDARSFGPPGVDRETKPAVLDPSRGHAVVALAMGEVRTPL